MAKRTCEKAFERKYLSKVKLNDYCVKIDMFKVLEENEDSEFVTRYNIQTTEKTNFKYGESVIKQRAKSATLFDGEEALTKTELIELFSKLSIHDVWSVEYEILDKSKDWQKELTKVIQNLSEDEASTYIKKNFKSFGKVNRKIIGHKIEIDSKNNYYKVCDLEIHFELLNEEKTVGEAEKQSIRNLDVNTIRYLIFNGVKYVLKI